jgi:hypothetical protein
MSRSSHHGDTCRQRQHSIRPYVERSRGERPFKRTRDTQSRGREHPSSKHYPYYHYQERELPGERKRPRETTRTQHQPRADTENTNSTPTSLCDLLTSLASADFTCLDEPAIENIHENKTTSITDCIDGTSTVNQRLSCIDKNQLSIMGCKGCRLPSSPPETYYDEICTCAYCPRCDPEMTTEYDPVYPHYHGRRCVCENFQ